MVKEMCVKAGIIGNFTNHSLRSTGATALYQAGVPETLIKRRTGHRSAEGLRQYERTSSEQNLVISKILAPNVQHNTYTEELKNTYASSQEQSSSGVDVNQPGVSSGPSVSREPSSTIVEPLSEPLSQELFEESDINVKSKDKKEESLLKSTASTPINDSASQLIFNNCTFNNCVFPTGADRFQYRSAMDDSAGSSSVNNESDEFDAGFSQDDLDIFTLVDCV